MKQQESNSFIFYRSFHEAIKEVSKDDRLALFDAICEYGLDGVETPLKGVSKALFMLIKPQMEANRKRFENGRKGGRPKNQSKTKAKPKQNQEESTTEPNANVNLNVNENVNENVETADAEKPSHSRKSGYPTIEEFSEYCSEKLGDYDLDVENIYYSYAEADWHDSRGNKIKNWKQKLRQVWCKPESKRKASEDDLRIEELQSRIVLPPDDMDSADWVPPFKKVGGDQ